MLLAWPPQRAMPPAKLPVMPRPRVKALAIRPPVPSSAWQAPS
jgi:hypothetical protein